ncbi:tetratricopeptide repeat protein [uncultured Pseudodesulfovibrio sp.]|uniref:tetratricopeptide repeat protein n=1 Tax=uncultured Pseudodesulfovibrio sp. TaxID=2035858 RepID=UPI0029C8C805|nr:tetratricopeptide repeat protein [uncultured Pseudodesulfovibrio sp.]
MNSILKFAILPLLLLLLTGCVMGTMYERQGTSAYLEKDYATAKAKYEEAVASGNPQAMYHLAVMYAEGQGVEQDQCKAAELLEKAAALGQDDARLMLGLFNLYGDGVPRDVNKAAGLIKTAAENGNDTAMYYLANLYAAGLGVQKDVDKGLYWMLEARDAGFPVKDELLTRDGLAGLYE